MKIALASDHAGIELKEAIKIFLKSKGYSFSDFGTHSNESTDYPIWGYKAAKAVVQKKCELGIVICGTGVGISLAANKVDGIRCVNCSEPYSAKMSKTHNDCNMLALGARVVGIELALMIVETFLTTSFEGGRHGRRVDLLTDIEQGKAIG